MRKVRVHHSAPDAVSQAVIAIREMAAASGKSLNDAVVVCVGTDRSTGDSVGPLVGTFLSEMGIAAPVYGTLDEPVHAMNLAETLRIIGERHPSSLMLAVDATLSNADTVGNIVIALEPLRPGEALGKDLPPVGDITLAGCVNVSGFMEIFLLQSTRLSLSYALAKTISKAISMVVAKPAVARYV